jgi:hypothetical protein
MKVFLAMLLIVVSYGNEVAWIVLIRGGLVKGFLACRILSLL